MTLPVKLRLDRVSLQGDLVRSGQFEVDDGFETAVILSLYTDRQADKGDELPDGTSDRRGWWGDAYADVEGSKIGSRLWLLRREKTTQETLNQAKAYAEEALAWMVTDGVALSVVVEAERVRESILGLRTTIIRNTDPASRYDRLWEILSNVI